MMCDEQNDLDPHHGEAWAQYIMAERQELQNRLYGHLRELLNGPLPGESPEELERLASEG